MSEQEWLHCIDPQRMLEFLRGKVSDRKLRLFACACCRQWWNMLKNQGRLVVNVAERYADGEAEEEERHCATVAATRSWREQGTILGSDVYQAVRIARAAGTRNIARAVAWLAHVEF